MIEDAYLFGEALGLQVWNQDEAGPFQTLPYERQEWTPEGQPKSQAHEYIRDGTAKCLTVFHPASGHLRLKGVKNCPTTILHGWLRQELESILAQQDAPRPLDPATTRMLWERWQAGLTKALSLPDDLPALPMLLIWDNLAGHKTPTMVEWLIAHGIMPLYTPLSGWWLNMAESRERILKRRALSGQHPTTTDEIIAWPEAVGRAWDRNPTPFVWGGKRAARRARLRAPPCPRWIGCLHASSRATPAAIETGRMATYKSSDPLGVMERIPRLSSARHHIAAQGNIEEQNPTTTPRELVA